MMDKERRIAQFLTDVARDYDRLSNYARKVNRTTDDLHDAILHVAECTVKGWQKPGDDLMKVLAYCIATGKGTKKEQFTDAIARDIVDDRPTAEDKEFEETLLQGLNSLACRHFGRKDPNYLAFRGYYINKKGKNTGRRPYSPKAQKVVRYLKTLGLTEEQFQTI